MKVLVIAVTYRTPRAAVEFTESILQHCRSDELSVVLVDNSDTPDGQVRPEDLPNDERVDLVRASGNLGYLGGARLGLSFFLESRNFPDWVAISNVDLRVRDPDALIRRLSMHSNGVTGVLAPNVVRDDVGRDLNPFMKERPSAIRMWAYSALFRSYYGFATYDALSRLKGRLLGTLGIGVGSDGGLGRPAPPKVIYAAHGSFFCLSSEFFRRGGTLNYKPFLFGEEIHIAEQTRRLSLLVIHDPTIQVDHRANASMRLLRSRVVHGFVKQSSLFIARTYFRDRVS